MSRRRTATIVAALLLVGTTACTSDDPDTSGPDTVTASESPDSETTSPTAEPSPTDTETADPPSSPEPPAVRQVQVAGTVASDLEVPWGMGFLPDGRALITQRNSALVSVVERDGSVRDVHRFTDVATDTSEGGLLGLAVSPDFANDQTFFVYLTTGEDNRVISLRLTGDTVSDVRPILTGIPRGSIHDGGQLKFGPDGFLYVSTGETGVPDLAQDRDSLGGKILRITADGRPAPDNPDPASPVWTLGHRNVQGLTFDDQDRLWATEFGSDVWDELNLIEAGNNYGWPAVEGNADQQGYVDPRVQWRPDDASPSSVAYADGSLWVAALNGSRLWEVPLTRAGETRQPRSYFVGDYGRLRAVIAAPDGSLWLTTSNRDGRGSPAPQDDRILRITLTA
jgi:glucose/arabinose dehydrogenase